jgi:DNA-directed RNA polymerase specialized sigma24 family protein
MPNSASPSPRKLTSEQLQRLRAFIYAEPIFNHQAFIAKWLVSRELIAQLSHVDIRTVNAWFSQGRTHLEPQLYHKWYLTLANAILEQYEELPEPLRTLLCPLDDNF